MVEKVLMDALVLAGIALLLIGLLVVLDAGLAWWQARRATRRNQYLSERERQLTSEYLSRRLPLSSGPKGFDAQQGDRRAYLDGVRKFTRH